MPDKKMEPTKSYIMPTVEIDSLECPFREFRDNELSVDYWGMNPATLRTVIANKVVVKQAPDYVWVDEQTQPLPRSVRQYLHGWVRADELALSRWEEAETVVFEENGADRMSIVDMQISHTQVLQRSAFCRRVLSACYILERCDITTVEHQWENFSFVLPEGWRPRYHIYSPGIKPGGGAQHRPTLSRNGCYLVRLYYLGAWRCVWVSDQVPVDATGAPLLPFSPLFSSAPTKQVPGRQQAPVATVTSAVVHLWPLLLCKALLKLAAPDMNSDEETDSVEDEEMPEFKIIHTLTGAMETDVWPTDNEDLWEKLAVEVPAFMWDAEDDDTLATKSKAVKKDKTAKDMTAVKRCSMAIVNIDDTKELPPYTLPGISPGHEMGLYVAMVRDVPLKKPLPEPEVALWKYYRWVDWARRHGLYEEYDFPRCRFLKLTGFLKLSYAPHLLDVQSTETITTEFRKIHDRSPPVDKKGAKIIVPNSPTTQKEELRDWVLFDNISELVNKMSVIRFPSMFNFTTVGSAPPLRLTKLPMSKTLDIVAPKSEPMYLQIDSPDRNRLKISLSIIHPRVMLNCGAPVLDYVEPAYLILESLDWFVDLELPRAKAYVRTRGYNTVEVEFSPGRHYCRLWVHSSMNWHLALLSESSLLLGTQDMVQAASVRECPWAIHFLSNLGTAFTNLLKTKSSVNVGSEEDFYKSYQPDLTWDEEVVGYKKNLVHWMFRKALQSLLTKRLSHIEFQEACKVLRRYLLAPDFGLPEKNPVTMNYRQMAHADPCDCTIPEGEQIEESEHSEDLQIGEEPRYKVSQTILNKLLTYPLPPATSQICELATSDHTCGVLKEEMEKMVQKHEAATLLQAHWRGTMARKYLREKVVVTPEINKCLMETAFGHPEALSALMNEFFIMFPGAKQAYSVSSALCGTTGLHTFNGISPVLPRSKWIPYFQGVFHCHQAVKVHFALQGTLSFNTLAVYNNDTGTQMPQAFRAAKTFDFKPNNFGYTVMGHGTVPKPMDYYSEAHWQLTVLSSIKDVFHVCDSPITDYCREMALPQASKLHIDCLFVPNRRNILGGLKLMVTQYGVVSFRAAASSPDLDIVAILRTQTDDGKIEVVDKCEGKGELYWPYIKLEPASPPTLMRTKSLAASRSHAALLSMSLLSKKSKPGSGNLKQRSTVKLQTKDVKSKASIQAKFYFIELSCPDGWPLTLEQWTRVEEVRNNLEPPKIESAAKKPPTPSKTSTARDKTPSAGPPPRMQPQPGDAYAELECSVGQGCGIFVEQDFSRDLEFETARRLWDSKEPGRNQRGAQIRKEFREEFLEVPVAESTKLLEEEIIFTEYIGEEVVEAKKENVPVRPSPVTDSGLLEMSIESEEEVTFLNLPEALKDKFVPLPFIPLCLKESSDEAKVLITPEMAEAGKSERLLHFEGALNRMRELQEYNKLHVLTQHRNRCNLLVKLFVDASWTPELHQVLEGRDEAIAQEALAQTENAQKKKLEQKKK